MSAKVEDSFGNEGRSQEYRLEILDTLIMPGDRTWLFLTNGHWRDNVVVVAQGVIGEKRLPEPQYIWAAYGPKVAALWYGRMRLDESDLELESIETDRPGELDAVVRVKSNGEKWGVHVSKFSDVSTEAIGE